MKFILRPSHFVFFRPAGTLIRNFLLFICFFPAGPLGGNFDNELSTFYLIFFCPARPLCKNFDNNLINFYCIFFRPTGPLDGFLASHCSSFTSHWLLLIRLGFQYSAPSSKRQLYYVSSIVISRVMIRLGT